MSSIYTHREPGCVYEVSSTIAFFVEHICRINACHCIKEKKSSELFQKKKTKLYIACKAPRSCGQ